MPFPSWLKTEDCPVLPYPRALVPSHPHVRNSYGSCIFYSLLKEHCRVKNRVSQNPNLLYFAINRFSDY